MAASSPELVEFDGGVFVRDTCCGDTKVAALRFPHPKIVILLLRSSLLREQREIIGKSEPTFIRANGTGRLPIRTQVWMNRRHVGQAYVVPSGNRCQHRGHVVQQVLNHSHSGRPVRVLKVTEVAKSSVAAG